MSYVQIVQRLPERYRPPLLELVEAVRKDLREELAVRRQDFDALRAVVQELAEAQKRTEQRVEELAEAQKRTEQRVSRLEVALAELAEAQKRTEQRVSRLEVALAELAEAQKRTEQRVEELAQAQKRTEQRVEELAQAQKRTEQRVEELAQAQKRTEQRVEELAQAQARTEQILAKVVEEQRRMQSDLAELKGESLQRRYLDRAWAYFGHLLRRIQVQLPKALDADMEERLEAHLTPEELTELFRVDALVAGQPRQRRDIPELWLVVEVSSVVDKYDVERALQRAELLRKAGYTALPAVAGERLTKGAEAAAATHMVTVLLDGHPRYWEEALEAL